jgi:hypothetical protein
MAGVLRFSPSTLTGFFLFDVHSFALFYIHILYIYLVRVMRLFSKFDNHDACKLQREREAETKLFGGDDDDDDDDDG